MFCEIKFWCRSSLSYRIRRMENIDLRVMNINNITSDLAKNAHKWLLGLRKLKSPKKKKFFANWTYFISCIMKKNYFLLWTRETVLFPYFYYETIFYSAELCDCAVNFKFYQNIFTFLNKKTNQTWKEQYFNYEAATYFGISPTKWFCKLSVRPAILKVFYPLRVFFDHIFPTYFLQNFS